MLTGQDLGKAIEAARLKKGVTKSAMAATFQVTSPSIQGWVNTGRIDKTKLIEVIRYFSDVVGPEHWGLTQEDGFLLQPLGESQASEPQTAAEMVRAMLATRAGRALGEEAKRRLLELADEQLQSKPVAEGVVVTDIHKAQPKGDEIHLAHYDVRGAMGGGRVVQDYPELFRDVTVSQTYLRELGVSYKDPSHLKIITGDGQSMAPKIQHLDPMIGDVSIREFTGDGIYAFVWQHHFYIKSLQIEDDEHYLMVSADRDLYPPKKIRIDDTYIQARILLVWTAKRV
ncbi:S24 family peptidase [Pseudomonas tohonis]|uniref:S24 family peptidase n=1 Tax=Pseudomonas tohonis TaxID=2725477 RepID=UPI001F4235A7|nr:S24 family peptidase [Pseudomonas tohonis]